MGPLKRGFPLNPGAVLGRRNADLILVSGLLAILATMLLPLPSFLLDGMLATNLTFGLIILAAVLTAQRPLELSAFPTVLLLCTLFRLSLNISSTRMILSRGRAGEVISAFGHFVTEGDMVVGAVMFLILTLVQFLVIAKGAERVAEVGARFTLDAMPGKQMAIDAELRAGALTEKQAEQKRHDLQRESQFYGSMDGAMKFVKGDAIAGLVITGLNIVAGLLIGTLRFQLSPAVAAEHYAVLTIGDGLVSQIPALLLALSAGILTTRVAAPNATTTLGSTLGSELGRDPRVLGVAAGFCGVMAIAPGMPAVPFLVLAAALGTLAWRRRHAAEDQANAAGAIATATDPSEDASIQPPGAAPRFKMAPLSLSIGTDLSRALGLVGDAPSGALTQVILPQMRDALYLETGLRFPGVEVRCESPEVSAFGFVIRVKEVPVFGMELDPDKLLAFEHPQRLIRHGVDAGPAANPLTGAPAAWVPGKDRALLDAQGVAVWDLPSIVGLFLAAELKKHAKDFIGIHETSAMLDELREEYGTLIDEAVPKTVTLAQLADVLRRLVDENIPVRDMKTILETLVEFGPSESDGVALTEAVRAAFQKHIAHAHADPDGWLYAFLLDPMIEESVRDAITQGRSGHYLALDPEIRRQLLDAIGAQVKSARETGRRFVLLTHAGIRRYVRKLIEDELPDLGVLSFDELPSSQAVQPLGRIGLEANEAAASA